MTTDNTITTVRRTVLRAISGLLGIGATGGVASARDSDTTGHEEVAFADLSKEGKSMFTTALGGEVVTTTVYDLPAGLAAAERVTYRGETYTLDKSGRHVTNYAIKPETTTSATDPITFEDLTASEKTAFNTALADGEFSAIGTTPDTFQAGRAVEKDGTTYRLNLMWGTSKQVDIAVN